MIKNKLKQDWKNGVSSFCGWLHISDFWTTELMARAGWDAVCVDTQHGLFEIEKAIRMLQTISITNVVPLARVGWNIPSNIMKLLDAGALGIICPMINTKKDCEDFVSSCKYPPLGYRSFGPTRARVYGSDYGAYANEEILTIAMIETKESLENLEDILSVKNLDAIFIGSGDLKLSLTGQAGHTLKSTLFDEVVDRILISCQNNNVVPGIWCATIEEAILMKQKGFKFIAVKSDSMIFIEALNHTILQLKK